MRLKYRYEIMEVDNTNYAVAMEKHPGEFNGLVKLNGTARAIFELLKEETTEEAIVEELGRRYDVPAQVLAEDVHKTIEIFRGKNLLV